jgi:sigma-E factor negative regulatory protein RseA
VKKRKMETMDKMDNQELISALADGQLRGEAFARGVQAAAADERSREAWWAYHVVGEVLRTGRATPGTAPEAFLAKLRERLREEPAAVPAMLPVLAAARVERPAANDWRWKLVAGFASVAAVAAVGWNLVGSTAGNPGQPQLAVAPAAAPALVEASASAMLRDPRLDRLLAAHRQLGGAPALQYSGFLRNATFEGPAR